MKCVFAIAAGLLAGASAFTPLSTRSASKSAMGMSVFDEMSGAFDYRGKEFKFDPVSFVSYICVELSISLCAIQSVSQSVSSFV